MALQDSTHGGAAAMQLWVSLKMGHRAPHHFHALSSYSPVHLSYISINGQNMGYTMYTGILYFETRPKLCDASTVLSSSVSDGWLLQWLFRRFPCLHDKSKKIRSDLWCDPKVGRKSKKIQIWKIPKPAQQGTNQHIFLSALILLKFKEMRRDKESRWMDGDSS